MKIALIVLVGLVGNYAYSMEDNRQPTGKVHKFAELVISTDNNEHLPFFIVDKKSARVFAFLANGHFYKSTAGLMGAAIGDDSAPGIGKEKLADISREERTTPAGRFKSQLGLNLHKTEILWIDYDSGISMHPVVTSNPSEHRLERLQSPNPSDHRITYGCINVSGQFFRETVHPLFKASGGIVYILPEVRTMRATFGEALSLE